MHSEQMKGESLMAKKMKYMVGILCAILLLNNNVFARDQFTSDYSQVEDMLSREIQEGMIDLEGTLSENGSDMYDTNEDLQDIKEKFTDAGEISDDSSELFTSGESDLDSSNKSFDLILNENVTTEQFKELVYNISRDIEVSIIPEIALVHIVLPFYIEKNEFLNNEYIQQAVYAQGKLPEMNVPQNPVNDIYLPDINSYSLFPFYARMTSEELFYAMAWHVNEVTNNGASLEISKGAGVKIALVDSGIDIYHPLLAGKIDIERSRSYVDDDLTIQDNNGHGTSVAGIIAQLAPEARMVSYRVIGETSGDSEWTINALIQAANDGNDIINVSLGTYKCSDIESELLTITAFERAVQYVESKGCIVVAAAGNQSRNLDQYYEEDHVKFMPGCLDGVITVSATNKDGLASYSNYGSNIDYCAPGGDLVYIDGAIDISQWIYCLYPTTMDNGLTAIGIPQGYTFSYGTSLAVPEVTAALADILSKMPEASTQQLVDILNHGVRDLGIAGYDIMFGIGKIDIEASLRYLLN